jgi:hypothetical protein
MRTMLKYTLNYGGITVAAWKHVAAK